MHFFQHRPALIGMVHLRALPGTPFFQNDLKAVFETALAEAKIYAEAGMDGLMIENMHDVPYLNEHVGAETTALMTAVAVKLRQTIRLPMGVQVLAGANKEALAVALAAGLDWIRAEGFVFGHIGDEGYLDAQAGELLRYRRMIRAEHVQVWTDIKKKHSSHAVTGDVHLGETARAAEFFRSQALVITGSSTGRPTDPQEVRQVKAAVNIPVVIGSGVNIDNLDQFLEADAVIVGSSLKQEGHWTNPVDPARVQALVEKRNRLIGA